jgi:hypothetical protein
MISKYTTFPLFTFSQKNEKLLHDMFEFFVGNYLYLIGIGSDNKPSLHEHLHSICHHIPSDFEPYGERTATEVGADCSSGCKHFLKLSGKLGADWGVCESSQPARGVVEIRA